MVSEGVRALAGKAHSCNCSKNQEEGRGQKDEESGNEKSQEKQENAVTIEQVRAVMASKSQDGKTQQVKALIQKYGADKLSGVQPEKYADLLRDAKGFNGTACDIIRICLQTMDELYPMTWKLHNYLKKELEAFGIGVVTTRTNQNTDRALYERGAASKGCNLFISVHSNAVGNGVNENVDYPVHMSF